VTLNVNKNTEPVRALGKMLLQNLQLVVGKRYGNDEQRRMANRPLFSVVLDEFAPLWIPELSADPADARGTNTAFLFSMQSLPQLMHVGRGFKEDVASAPNHNYDAAKLATRKQRAISASLGGASGHTAQSVDGAVEVLRARKIRGDWPGGRCPSHGNSGTRRAHQESPERSNGDSNDR